MTLQLQSLAAGFRRKRVLAAAIAATLVAQPVWADVSTNQSNANTSPSLNDGPVGTHNPAVTISLSGSTAMRSFTTSQGITFLTPGTSITLANGQGGALTTYTAPTGGTVQYQLASGNFTNGDVISGNSQNHSAIRLEWHEQGSVEGILDMINDQIGYFGSTPIVDPSTRNPVLQSPAGSTFSNPIWVNRNVFNGSSAAQSVGNTVGTGVAQNGLFLGNSDYNTYSSATYNLATGQNLQHGQNRVQMAISDVAAVQGFAISGANGAFNLTPQTAGYGKGNNQLGLTAGALPSNGMATPGSQWSLHDQTALNMETTKVDPQTGANYATGAWNTAGLGNLVSSQVAVTATLFAANPGTGLTRLNRTDAQWLQTTGRLQNGAAFNMTTRDVGSGTRNVAALNTGVDPAFAVGVNDAGNGNNQTAGATAQEQLQIGGAQTAGTTTGTITQQYFSNKTAGGGQLRPTIQNNRMSIGTLGISDALSSVKDNGSSTPLRGLDYADSATNAGTFVRASASSITDASYAIYQNENYVTVKAPDAQYGSATPNIKGDNSNHDVANFKGNVLSSVANFPATSVANPADQLLANGFILPQMMVNEKPIDGVGNSSPNPGYNSTLRTQFLGSTYANNFAVADPSTVTTGNSSTYGNAGRNVVGTSASDKIAISSSNYLFGNFNQNGIRDFSAVQSAQAAQSALFSSGLGTSLFTGGLNSAKVSGLAAPLANMQGQLGTFSSGVANTSTGASKGDLIVMGDVNGDGKFDGQDLYLMAKGAAVADSAGGTTLTIQGGETGFGDAVRRGILVKNAALDYMQSHATAQQKIDATANATNDPTGANAFNRFEVNRDGVVNLDDARIIDHFYGKSYANINDQLSATINTNGTIQPGPQKPINLVDVSQLDGPTRTHLSVAGDATAISGDDFKQFTDHNPGIVKPGDATLDGHVDFADFIALSNHFGASTSQYSAGDFNDDGNVGFDDFITLSNNFGTQLTPSQAMAVLAWGRSLDNSAELAAVDAFAGRYESVPEPGSLALIGLAAGGLLVRRRRA